VSRSGGDQSTPAPTGAAWSLAGFVVIGLSGLAITIVIENGFDVEALGRFNVLLSILLIAGQVGTAGRHAAVLFMTPSAVSAGKPTAAVLKQAVRTVVPTAIGVALAVVVPGFVALTVSGSEDYRIGLLLIAPALALYPVNKVLASHLNGLRRIRAFSSVTAGRFMAIVIGLLVASATGVSGTWLPAVISVAEMVVAIGALAALRSELWNAASRRTSPELSRYGRRLLIGGLLLDLSTRIDVLVLAMLAGPRAVGEYSVASVFGEGLYQLAIVVRFAVDPVVTQLHDQGRHDELRAMVRRIQRRVVVGVTAVGVLSIAAYGTVTSIAYGDKIASSTFAPYVVLAVGVMLASPYIPFTNFFQQTGRPSLHSGMLASATATNLVLNLALVPSFGTVGAAIGTAVSWSVVGVVLRARSGGVIGSRR
jgi:O-antigen/teichoic acid export membrane protein